MVHTQRVDSFIYHRRRRREETPSDMGTIDATVSTRKPHDSTVVRGPLPHEVSRLGSNPVAGKYGFNIVKCLSVDSLAWLNANYPHEMAQLSTYSFAYIDNLQEWVNALEGQYTGPVQ